MFKSRISLLNRQLSLFAVALACGLFVSTAGTVQAHVRGTVFCDTNNNGILDAGEPGIPGVTVTLCDGETRITDANGKYSFDYAPRPFPCTVAVDTNSVIGDCNVPGCATSRTLQDVGFPWYYDDIDFCFHPPLPPGSGCPASFWKDKKTIGDSSHPTKWVGYSPTNIIKTVFVNATKQVCSGYGDEGNKKIKDALGWGTNTGNLKDAFKNLMREAVAALLNAASPLVNYPATEAEVILMVNDALASCDRAVLISLANDLRAANNVGSPACNNTSTGNCTTDGKPNMLTLTYTGGACADAVNSQPLGTKYNCSESNSGLTGVTPVRIIVSSSSSVPTATSTRFFDELVAINDSFDVFGSFGSNTYFFIYENGVLKQTVGIHTSCSAPLVRTETFGGLQLEDYAIVP